MIVPIVEFNNKKLMLTNCLIIRDLPNKAVVVGRNGFQLEFVADDAELLFEEMQKVLDLSDRMQLPIVGVGNVILILTNFPLVEDLSEDDLNKVLLTLDDGEEIEFTGTDAALILSRMDTLAAGTRQIFDKLESVASN